MTAYLLHSKATETSMAKFISVWPEAAEYLGIRSKSRAYALAAAGYIPVVRLGRRRLVPLAALEALVDAATERALAATLPASPSNWSEK